MMDLRRIRQRTETGLALARLIPAYVAFGLLKHVVPIASLARFAWRETMVAQREDSQVRAVARVVKVRTLLRRWDRDCVQTSLLMYRELSRVGADPMLAIGFRRSKKRLEGHAWVIVGGVAVADTAPSNAEFTPACFFGRCGAVARVRPLTDSSGSAWQE